MLLLIWWVVLPGQTAQQLTILFPDRFTILN